ncbi:MAG: hypothetical protein UV01_C0001G0091 [Parcubacteria group bacterium GW2011_GWA2_42_14]|nr:MAG: hypothetical protein UV01_C0001G0091 [Parcubacteria group bacterium GW2011_GWA2_42_14]
MSKTTIQIPKHIFEDIIEAGRKFSVAEDELEDFLLATNQDFLKKMRRLRVAHNSGRLGNWQKLKAKYGL